MTIDRTKISIRECSFEEYEKAKKYQRLKPPEDRESNTIYGLIEEESLSINSLAKQIDDSLNLLKIIKKLEPRPEEAGNVFLRRIPIYENLKGEIKKLYSNTTELGRLIKEGRGIDLIFLTENNESEIHYYRTRRGENVFLVETKVPKSVLEKNIYRFTRATKDPYSVLKATSQMPKQEIKLQYLKRRSIS